MPLGSQPLGNGNLGGDVGDIISRFEIAQSDIIAEFQEITQVNGYRNDVANVINAVRPFEAISYTEIGVVIPTWNCGGNDQLWTVFDSVCDVVIQGVVCSNTSNEKDATILNKKIVSLAHDMTRVMYKIMNKYINNTYRWNVIPKPFVLSQGLDFGQQENQGVIYIGFQIQLRSMDGQFL